jgi:hypothetical protein
MVSLSNHADVEAEQIGQERRKPCEGDPLGEAQIDDEGAQVLPERRAFRHVGRRRRLEAPRAAGAGAAMKRHSRDIGFDRRNLDMIVGLAGDLRPMRHIGAAMLAGVGEDVALSRGVLVQGPMRAGMDLVPGLGRCRRGGFLPLARRRRGIVRRFRRQTELGFQLRNPLRQRGDHLGLRQDQRVLLGVRQACRIGRRGHPPFESDSRRFGNPQTPTRVNSPQGVSNYDSPGRPS